MRKAKFSKSVITKELWKDFIQKHPEHKKMSWNQFYASWQEIAQTIREEAVTNPLGVKLGSYTGEIKLQYLPYKFEAISGNASEKAGEKVKFLSLVTKGKMAKIKWERRWACKFNKMLEYYGFESTREMNKLAKEYIDKHPEKLRISRNTLGGTSIWRKFK